VLEVELRTAPLDAYRADPDAVAERIDRSTALVVAVAGSTEHGRVDPVSTLRDLAHDAGAPCRVDAAWGGFALPFTEHGRDFADTPVDTMTIDPHRLGQTAVPAGALLAWDRPVRGAVGVDPVPGDRLIGIAERDAIGGRGGPRPRSTRCGPRATAPAAGERADAVDYWLAAELRTRGRAVVDPELPLVATDIDPESVSALCDRGWRLSRTVGGWARIVVTFHVTRPVLERFLDDLDAVAPAEGGG
jgi:tyrosine decarboxylase/aspartate 1-decarboxylase